MNKLKIRLENTGLLMSIMTKLSLFFGGGIFLIYCSASGAFPENLSLGDGVWLLLIIFVFSFGMGTVYFFLGCFGVSLWTTAYHIFRISGGRERFLIIRQWFRERKTKKIIIENHFFFRNYKRDRPFSYKIRPPKINVIYHFISFFMIIIIFGTVRENHWDWYLRLILSSILLGFLFLFWHANWQRYLQIEHVEARQDESKRLKGEIKFANITFTAAVLILTTLYIGLTKIAADRTMIFLHVRSEQVTVFVKQPWDAVLERHLIRSEKQIANSKKAEIREAVPGYKQYDKMTVSLNNLGSSVFLEFKKGNKFYSLKIPSSDIIVDNVPLPDTESSDVSK
ncbi:hypothetical protein BV924_20835 [Pectobacterium odoriferum]|uniref:Uncharacterized protein n=1 Tax=Pectobacterium odoriferum TaxID=78398 RepID=A0ABD6VJC5_9GAMM|nr:MULTISPECIES: hypothetical protein [Pectobacterium]MBB1527378.1 hypothetical protein [Pectobacterium carotovorum subsp. carotovorum]POD97428.1 hypothetical protein BVY06_02930 [Pectobacterium odoriferum]POE08717.1 hypothetical protein BV924_20835 [Pectobacterium odoriferum]POE23249.1 hypothetical protein BV926_20755 [Pectobacterium odoriferum]POE27910.1 hypothetical protein BV919_20405 [Pectobacterium odoriferum]